MSTLTPIAGSAPPLGTNSTTDEAGGGVGSAIGTAATPAQDAYINPQIQVDPQSGVVILEYRDDAGKVARQVPSEYELRSYQLSAGTPPAKPEQTPESAQK